MRIALGIAGSIAAYRSPDLLRKLESLGHQVQAIPTQAALEFTTLKTLESFSRIPPAHPNPFHETHRGTDHIATARRADLFFIYGATANLISRIAQGSGDDFLTLQLLAFRGRKLIAPAMNPDMWSHPATQANVKTLEQMGYEFVGPISGIVACGEEGIGHVADFDQIISALKNSNEIWLGKRVLLTAGPMRTHIDSVRYIQNRSSGKMGLEIIRQAKQLGATVSVVLGPVENEMKKEFENCADEVFPYEGFQVYQSLCEREFPKCDLFISAAAVLDFEIMETIGKLSRTEISKEPKLTLDKKNTHDVFAKLSKNKKPHQTTVAFALESSESFADAQLRAQEKLKNKNADFLCLNQTSPQTGFESNTNEMWIYQVNDLSNPVHLKFSEKPEIARELLKILS